jgi:CheY-like chemotaxis protein
LPKSQLDETFVANWCLLTIMRLAFLELPVSGRHTDDLPNALDSDRRPTMTQTLTDQQQEVRRSRGAEIAHRLFDHLGVPRRERAKRLEELMGWTYHPAHRRLIGEIPWSVDELECLAQACGMSLAETLNLNHDAGPEGAIAGSFLIAGTRIPCKMWLDDARKGVNGPLVAVRTDDQWTVTSSKDAAASQAIPVRRVLLEPDSAPRRFRIAVLDDNEEVSQGLSAYLRLSGFEAQPFATTEELLRSTRDSPFDGYVLDWLVGSTTSAATIAEIRGRSASCPIVVLTGKIREGQADEDQVATIVTLYRALFFEKPAAAAIIAAQLKHALEPQPRG